MGIAGLGLCILERSCLKSAILCFAHPCSADSTAHGGGIERQSDASYDGDGDGDSTPTWAMDHSDGDSSDVEEDDVPQDWALSLIPTALFSPAVPSR